MITPRDPITVRSALVEYSREKSRELSRGEKGAIIGYLNTYGGGDDMRKFVLGWIFSGKIVMLSTHDLTDGQWAALADWISSFEEDGEWKCSITFSQEITEIVRVIREWMQSIELTTLI